MISYFIVIEVTSGEYGDHNEVLVEYIDNGKSIEWSKDKCSQNSEYLVNIVVNYNVLFIIYFVCIACVQLENNGFNCSRHKLLSKYFNELRILFCRTLIISSRDSVCILHL